MGSESPSSNEPSLINKVETSDVFAEKGNGVSHTEQVDLSKSLEARLRNPLEGLSHSQLMANVDEFAAKRGLQDKIELLRKGAQIAQHPESIDEIQGITPKELDVLNTERTNKWKMPMRLILTIAICSIGAAVQGWDQTGANGATIFFPRHYGIDPSEDGISKSESQRRDVLVGIINAAPYIGSAFIGCWLSDPINNWFGRRGTIFFSAHFCIWPVIGSALCHTWEQQLACRLLMGIGMGAKASTVPIYAAENAPAAVRGALVMSWQMWTAFGIMLGTAINLAVFHVGEPLNWRLMLGAPFIPAVPLLVGIWFCPESPRWYMKKGRFADAWDSMSKLRYNEIQVARDIFYIGSQLDIEEQLTAKSNYVTRFTQLFTIPRVRRANLAAFTVMIAQQMCGINIIAFYSTSIFKESGLSEFQAMIGSFGFGLVNWLFAFPAFFTIDKFGRRSLLLFTFPNMFWTLLAAGLSTLAEDRETKKGLVCLFVFMFAAFYSPGEGPVPFTYSAEVYPLSHRETGMGFAVATCLFWAAVLGTSFPFLLHQAKPIGAFGVYAGFNVVAFVMIFFFVPETMQRTLEELDWVFAVPVRKFARYQLFTNLPYFFKRYIFRNKDATKPPLYHFEAVEQQKHGHNVHAVATPTISDDEKMA